MTDIHALKSKILADIYAEESLEALEGFRVATLGKKGVLTELTKTLAAMTPEERKTFGQAVNAAKGEITHAFAEKKAALEAAALEAKLLTEEVDITLSPRPERRGSVHLVSRVTEEVIEIFAGRGFAVAEGPDIESEENNFDKLNIPADHPARRMHDTFYLQKPENGPAPLLRTHTSPVQIRAMTEKNPPFRLIAPGRVYRCDSDMTHTPMFHQVEGLVIDKDINMGHLRGLLEDFLQSFFETDRIDLRFRPSFFPFTEPSIEVDVRCDRSKGAIKIGEGEDWLEILGAGMVHPNVLQACGVDPEIWQGFAFGVGIDRLAMLKYGAPDLRAFFESDIRWLKHYGFSTLRRPSLAAGLS